MLGATPVFIVKGGNVFTGEDSREVSDKRVLSLTYPSSISLEVVVVVRCCCREKYKKFVVSSTVIVSFVYVFLENLVQ